MIDVPWEPHHLNDPSDIARSEYGNNDNVGGVGAVVGGDDALRDGSDSTYLESATTYGHKKAPMVSWRMRPTRPVPSTPIVAVSWHARFLGSTSSEFPYTRDTNLWVGHDSDYQFPWLEAWPASDVITDREQLHGEPGTVRFSVITDYVRPGWEDRFWVAWVGFQYGGVFRLHDFGFTTHHEGALPLRQIQRDDHLAPGGTIRASTGTSRQGSIRQRGYE